MKIIKTNILDYQLKNLGYLRNLQKANLNLISQKIVYSLSIFGFVFILGFIFFFISQSKKNKSNITNKPILLEKGF